MKKGILVLGLALGFTGISSAMPSSVTVEGVDGPVDVELTLVATASESASLTEDSAIAEAAFSLLSNRSGLTGTDGAELKVYEITQPEDKKFWLGRTSSMGNRSVNKLLEAIRSDLVPYDEAYCGEEWGKAKLLDRLFGNANTQNLAPLASAASDFIKLLSDEEVADRVGVEQTLFTIGCERPPFQYSSHSAFFVDPQPYRGAETKGYLVTIDRFDSE